MLQLKFDTSKITKNLRNIQFAAIPEAQKKSLYKFGFLNKKKLRQEMITGQGKFMNPVPLTLAESSIHSLISLAKCICFGPAITISICKKLN